MVNSRGDAWALLVVFVLKINLPQTEINSGILYITVHLLRCTFCSAVK